jgi:hypothetical protein
MRVFAGPRSGVILLGVCRLALALLLLAGIGYADPPRLMNFQGRLCDSGTGKPLPDGQYSIVFSIYDIADGGEALWTETLSAQVRGGVFGVVLGEVTALDLSFDRDYWLGIRVESDPEIAPRSRLVSAGYAINADTVDAFHASATPEAGKLLALDQDAKFPNQALHTGHGEGLDADTVDGYHAEDLMGSGGAYVELAPEQSQPGAAVQIEGDDLPLSVRNSAPTQEVKGAKIQPPQSPAARQNFAMCAIGSGKAVLFGGDTGEPESDTWIYDAAADSWSAVAPSLAPPERQEHGVAYDPVNNRVILFGGYSETGRVFLGDTWAFDPDTGEWAEMSPAAPPPPRAGHAMAYAGSGKVVLFGGLYLDDTWAYDYAADEWTELHPAQSPGGRYGHSLAYDSVSKKIVLFGGEGTGPGELGDTWVFDPAAGEWAQSAPEASPQARSHAAMAFDSEMGEILLFGGHSASAGQLADFWAYSLSSNEWRELPVDTGPGARRGHSMAFIPSENVSLVFGGYDGASRLGDTWEITLFQSGLAAHFSGSTHTTGNAYAYSRTGGSCDLAELFPAAEPLEPGDVVVIDGDLRASLRLCDSAYDRRAAGVVSTFPSFLMGTDADGTVGRGKVKLALAGRVPCKVDAGYAPIEPGDLLTTSPTPGYAMKAEPITIEGVEFYAPGSVIGKALEPLESGRGEIEVLVMGR